MVKPALAGRPGELAAIILRDGLHLEFAFAFGTLPGEQVLGDREDGRAYIETIPKRGATASLFQLRSSFLLWSRHGATGEVQPLGPLPRQEIRFCVTSDGVRLALASVGSGYPLVKAAN